MSIGKLPTGRQGKNTHNQKKSVGISGWDRAIADAKEKISALEFSIGVFEQHKREGREWPGNDKAEKADALPA